MNTPITRFILFGALLLPFFVHGTIIIPPSDIGQLAFDSDIVVYGKITGHVNNNPYQNQLKILQLIKGDTQEDFIIVDEYGQRIGDLIDAVTGDTDFQIGKNYLLFLNLMGNGHYKSRLMAYSVFVEIQVEGKNIFAHEEAIMDVVVIDNGADMNGLRGAYEVDPMLNHLSKIVRDNIAWDEQIAGRFFPNIDVKQEKVEAINGIGSGSPSTLAVCPNTPPAHCTVISGAYTLNTICNSDSPAKYASNSWTIYVAGGAASDPSVTVPGVTEIGYLTTAITSLTGMDGITAVYGGIDATFSSGVIDCVYSPGPPPTTSGISGDRLEFAGGVNSVYVFFDDPCSEIPALGGVGGCSGTLGRGGHWWSSSCHTDPCGDMWRSSSYPYLYMNDGVGCLPAGTYIGVIIHEILHSMGVGHIGVGMACTAIMNPTVCNSPAPSSANNYNISTLDEDCTDWMYDISAAMPVEFVQFDANPFRNYVELNWTTATEINNDYFTIERSLDGRNFEELEIVKGAGNSTAAIGYQTYDRFPVNGENYYRLKQTDFDEVFTYSDVVSVTIRTDSSIEIFPNPVEKGNVTLAYNAFQNGDLGIEIFDLNGKLISSLETNISKGHNQIMINVSDYKNGMYVLRASQESIVQTTRFVRL